MQKQLIMKKLLEFAKGVKPCDTRSICFVVDRVNGEIITSQEFFADGEATAGTKQIIIKKPGVKLSEEETQQAIEQARQKLEKTGA